ncbi:MAG: LysM peptidoglycan-binding domain-containing protein [Treponema sp.]|nr:LysM peptidoglycan-binding domain-containing protein [Treponema sp.]
MLWARNQAIRGALILLCAASLGAEPLAPDFTAIERPLRWIPETPSARFAPRHTTPLHLPVIPGLEQELTQRYISRYSTPGGLEWLAAVMRRGAPYMAFIRQEIEERGLPPELIYLPVIESGFLAAARSGSGAVGLWQFMRNSIGPFDMRVTEWMDERMDFWKSTQGALRKLEENYRMLGDWPLALAAYNAGMGAVSRIISQSGIRDYWLLSEKRLLKSESIQYVPKLLAVAYILSNPRRFGLDLNWPEDPAWVRVPVERSVDLELLAAESGLDRAELKSMNRELHYNITPPDAPYYLKVRAAHEQAVRETLAREDLALIRFYFHTIQYGDTLSFLARHYGVSVDQIAAANPGVQARSLKLGARLKIPALTDARQPPASPRQGGNAGVFEGTHTVKKGETLWSIALAYQVDPLSLAAANGMELNDTLSVGRRLKTPILKE